MTYHGKQLELDRCPYCNVDRPTLTSLHSVTTEDHRGASRRFWRFYQCARCGGVVTAASEVGFSDYVSEIYPGMRGVDSSLPERAQHYLKEALNSLHSPSGAVMLAASAVDAMLKAKDYKTGSLYDRIDKAAADHVITADMAKWAHQVRLEANDQRHADDIAPLPEDDDSKRVVNFAFALGDFLFVLPSRVSRGIKAASEKRTSPSPSENKRERIVPPPNIGH